MEKQLSEMPVPQKTELSPRPVTQASSCCSQPAKANPCCNPSKDSSENNGACCAQAEDGSSCCDK